MLIIRLLAIGFVIWLIQLIRKTYAGFPKPSGQSHSISNEDFTKFRDVFPGYDVRPSDFVLDDSKSLWRVNSDGSAHLVMASDNSRVNKRASWIFDQNSGEFFPITKSNKRGTLIGIKKGYDKRLVEFISGSSIKHYISGLFCSAWGVLGIVLFFSLFPPLYDSSSVGPAVVLLIAMPMCLFIGYIGLVHLITSPTATQKLLQVGPEPLKRRDTDFGPGTIHDAPATGPATDLAYKPSA